MPKIHPAYLFEGQEAGRIQGPWGLLQTGRDHPGDQAFRPLSERCLSAGKEVAMIAAGRVPAGSSGVIRD